MKKSRNDGVFMIWGRTFTVDTTIKMSAPCRDKLWKYFWNNSKKYCIHHRDGGGNTILAAMLFCNILNSLVLNLIPPILHQWNFIACTTHRQVNCKICLKMFEISWFAWIFWLVFCCVVWSHFAIVKMPQLRWSVLARKNKAAVSDELLPLLHDWSIYIPVFPKYLNSSSLSKQKFFYCYFGISSHEKIWINLWFLDSDYSFLPKLVRNLSVWSRINLNSLALQKNFHLLSKKKNEDFLGKTGV